MIPSIETCFELMDKYRMLENIKTHSIVVTKVAHLIALGLRDAGLDISIEKVVAGALLHDIGKTPSLGTGQDHSEIGRQLCLENHLDETASIVAEHVRLKNYNLNGDYSEKEIVYYSDKRVNHDTIVSLEDRLAYILDRYGKNKEGICRAIRMNFELCKRVEKKLFKKLTFSPESLADLAENEEIGLTSDLE
ncbi:MAG: HD domain-containing protein, partial [Deltaproteobacteria bacterium]|nr:HD domain-containing protein [Deltaproteobacteria bacterium]